MSKPYFPAGSPIATYMNPDMLRVAETAASAMAVNDLAPSLGAFDPVMALQGRDADPAEPVRVTDLVTLW